MSKVFASAKELKEGRFVLIDDIPCKVASIDSSKPGKHGAAKMRVVAIGVFDGQKKTLLVPSDADVEIPVIERQTAQIVALNGTTAQLMDTTTFETYELEVPEEYLDVAATGKEAEVMEAMGKRAITRIK